MNPEQILLKLIQFAASAETSSICCAELEKSLDNVWSLAQRHDLAHLAAHAIPVGKISNNDILSEFQTAKTQAIYRYLRLDHAYQQVCAILEDAYVSYIPLKGTVVREYYPEPWMRTSCDIDILVHENDLDHAVQSLTKQGWCIEGKKNYHDISLRSSSGVHLELHFSIKENIGYIDEILEKVWEYSALVKGKQYEYRQVSEFLIFHLLAHMSYHLLKGGCGIRSVLDIWILRNNIAYDENLLRALCQEGRLERFHDNVVLLSKVWFEACEHTPTTQYMEKLILDGGVYGSLSGRVILEQGQYGSKMNHFTHRLVLPYHKLKAKYPILERHKVLTPIYQVVRWIQIFMNNRLRRSLNELIESQRNPQNELRQAEIFLVDIGLDKFK